MEEKRVEKKQEMEINFHRILQALWKRCWLIAAVAVVTAVVSFLGTFFFITPKYESAAMLYVNNSVSLGDASIDITTGDLSASKELVESYIVILMTRSTLNDVIDYAGVDRTYEELKGMITASAVNATEIFQVTVTSPDPIEAEKLASAVAYVLPKRISTIIEGSSAEVVDTPIVAVRPSSPSYLNNAIIGFMIGLLLCVAVVVLREIFDITIRTEEDITQNCPHPILAAVPDMLSASKGGYYYGYGNNRGKENHAAKQPTTIGPEISFAASEAYKLLRTKLQFAFAGEKVCRVLGVSSGLAGEGKSLTTINLAYSLAQLNKKVLLVDCDMRRPSLATKLNISKYPGLSNYLSGLSEFEELVQTCNLKGAEHAFSVVTAGRNPPNPIELLSSEQMNKLLVKLRTQYDYVILDLPPVGEVSDALAIAKQTDGMLLVVRQNYCNRLAVSAMVRQFEFVEAKVLGVIYNAAAEHNGTYGKKYYKKYGRYGYKYASSYARAQHNATMEQAAEEQAVAEGSEVVK